MKKLVLLMLTVGVFFSLGLFADDDDGEESHERHGRNGSWLSFDKENRKQLRELDIVEYTAVVKTECSSCHMLYHPGLLPAASWKKMMGDLENHFGDNAALDKATAKEIETFLVTHSADKSQSRRSQKLMNSLGKETPLRFSETQYFNRKHHEIGEAVYKRKKIGSKANCLACHPGAEKGYFNEHQVKIPRT